MRKLFRRILICLLVYAMLWCGTLISDRQRLSDDLIRLHVVADSDSVRDQELKLMVRDAVMENLAGAMEAISQPEQAKAYLQIHLDRIRDIARDVLRRSGCNDPVTVTFREEAFPAREYDSFRLPAGVYDSVMITIGDGEGENWWCVVYPAFCMDAAGNEFSAAAASAGFPDSLSASLEGKRGYRLRFFLLDILGELEKVIFK